jgi:hypothetical protein
MVFAAPALFAGTVAIGTSGRKVVRYARAPVLLPQASRAVRCPIEMVLCSFPRPGALLRESGMWDATPSLGHLFSKAPAKFVSDERP